MTVRGARDEPTRLSRITRLLPLLSCAALAMTGCGEGADGESADPGSEEVAATAERGSGEEGTLVVGDRTYGFTVVRCGLDAQSRAQGRPLLRGRGTTEDGERLTVTVERLRVANATHETVRLRVGSINSDGPAWEASRAQRPDGSWARGIGPGGLDPLLEIDGRTIRAEGTFAAESGPEAGEEREGRFDATCPSS